MRKKMVETQIESRGVKDPAVIDAMKKVPRHLFMPEDVRSRAYMDSPAPIGHGQTISQPFIVASMTELLGVDKGDKILEIGTGSGYQAAVLAELGVELYSIEIVCELAERAEKALNEAEYHNVTVKCGDGYKGWPEHAPFDGIIVTAAPPEIPDALVEQLAVGGQMVVPVGETRQELKVLTKREDGSIDQRTEYPVRFVPMVPGEEDAGRN